MEHMSDLDFTAVQSLKTLNNGAGKHDVRLVLCNAQVCNVLVMCLESKYAIKKALVGIFPSAIVISNTYFKIVC